MIASTTPSSGTMIVVGPMIEVKSFERWTRGRSVEKGFSTLVTCQKLKQLGTQGVEVTFPNAFSSYTTEEV